MNDNKVICQCDNVTVKKLKDAIENGAKSFEEVKAITKVGNGCGKCVEHAKAIVDELLGK
ncbi:MAG TPA: (2Fe-2S)-binding protein [Clostridium sp.]